jgi:Tfp pilus assembly protein PilO
MRPLPKPKTRTLDRAGVAAALLLGLAVGAVLMGGNLRERKQLTAERVALTERLTYLTDLSRTLGEGQEALHQLETRMQHLEQRLPSTMAFETFYEDLSTFAEARGLSIEDLRPGTMVEHEAYESLPIELVASGSVLALNEFLYDLATHARLSKVAALDIATTDTLGLCDMHLTLNIYSTHEEDADHAVKKESDTA